MAYDYAYPAHGRVADYVRERADVVAISMSWGMGEFIEETSLDSHFTSDHAVSFFASSGDNGAGASWPATSPNVVAVGGTSAGAPQWAAVHALGLTATNERLYADKASQKYASFFRDITSGGNGNCGYFYEARQHYDCVTGLGNPLTVHF